MVFGLFLLLSSPDYLVLALLLAEYIQEMVVESMGVLEETVETTGVLMLFLLYWLSRCSFE